ncbi:MAG: methyl-accepting chemotaxis protein, partial [Spirochaetes bacterium]|nr:methyl-accepting chemotaxis protein [Spirochaetota bacterium]
MWKVWRFPITLYMFLLGMVIVLITSLLKTYLLQPVWGFGIVILIGGGFAWIFTVPLGKTLLRLQQGMKDVARGDLTFRIDLSSPIRELERVVHQFDNQLVGNLQILLLGMKDILEDHRVLVREFQRSAETSQTNTQKMVEGVEGLQRRYMDLNYRIEEMTGIVSSLHQSIQQVANQIAEQSGAIQQTSASVEQMTASIESVAKIALSKQETTQTLIRTSEEGGKKVSAAMSAMNQMAQGIEEIRTIVELINDVAARTNLLAMNAAIEATHAGQYGRGFAVVAAEIRKLAESTASHTKKVSNTLSDFTEKMRYLKEAAEVAFSTITQLNEEIMKFVDAFSEIVRGTQEAASGGKQMLVGVTALRTSAESLRTASESMRGSVGEIHSSIQSLREFARESYSQLLSIGKELKTIEALENDISRIGAESLDHINTLSTELKYFRLEKNGLLEGNEYSFTLKEIILNHKRMVYCTKAFLQGRLEKKHFPHPRETCPLDGWIHTLKQDHSFGEDLSLLEKKHQEFHHLYETLFSRADATRKEENKGEWQQLYAQLESRWKELIV